MSKAALGENAMDMLQIESLNAKEHRRLFASIQVGVGGECWIWTGSKDAAGYGLCFLRGKTERIHRVMYALHVGPVPRGIEARRHAQVHHVCRNTSCCNPSHLQLVSQRINVLEGISPPAVNILKTHCKRGHVLERRKDGTAIDCRICDSQRKKARKQGKNAAYWKQKSRESAQRWRDSHPGAAAAVQRRYRMRKRQDSESLN
jgi:hypothetical protein